MGYSWLSVHRVRFTSPKSAKDGAPVAPVGAETWRFGPHAPLGENGLRTGVSDVWGGIAFYNDRQMAEAVVADPAQHLDFLDDTAEHWHALACVITHRGEVDWSTPSEPHPALAPLPHDPGGVLAVITTAGYMRPAPEELDRIKPFLKKVDEVVSWYRTLDTNTAAMLFGAVEAKQGMTFSIWKTDPDMTSAAYRSGTHSDFLAMHRAKPMFDTSSFTRLRLISSTGSWDQADPRVAAL